MFTRAAELSLFIWFSTFPLCHLCFWISLFFPAFYSLVKAVAANRGAPVPSIQPRAIFFSRGPFLPNPIWVRTRFTACTQLCNSLTFHFFQLRQSCIYLYLSTEFWPLKLSETKALTTFSPTFSLWNCFDRIEMLFLYDSILFLQYSWTSQSHLPFSLALLHF